MHPVTVFVCTACRFSPSDEAHSRAPSPGEVLVTRLLERLPDGGHVRIEPVDCLAVCDRPCSIAFSGQDKWTYLIGDIDPEANADDILLVAARLAASSRPVLALMDRPPFFRKGVIGRIPPNKGT